jgi:hypothetical protein
MVKCGSAKSIQYPKVRFIFSDEYPSIREFAVKSPRWITWIGLFFSQQAPVPARVGEDNDNIRVAFQHSAGCNERLVDICSVCYLVPIGILNFDHKEV